MRYNNYHKHTHYSNLRTLDVIVKPVDYIKRAKELKHTTYFTTEHGWGGNVWEAYSLCQENGLKMIYGVEAYYVDNRLEKDRGNYHIIIIAKNYDGFKDINRIISEANKSGYYYKPRIDLELLLSLNSKNTYITTACIGSRLFKSNDYEEKFLLPVKKHFQENLYLETQSHASEYQSEYNKKILELSQKYNIKLIHANDSHYIKEEDSKYRNMFLNAKGMNYGEESEFVLDYPEGNEILIRYKNQGVLSEEQAKSALENTLIFDNCEDLGFNKEFKIPKVTEGDSNKKLKEIISNSWKEEKNNIAKDEHKKYVNEIKNEVDTVIDCGMSDYFILDHKIIKRAVEKYKAVLTRSGRGSGVSYYINRLLGLTKVDRINAPITLYPSRFMTAERILQSKSLPDIDLNFADVEPVIKASKDILGEDGVYYMIAFKPLQESSAFRLWCKAIGMHIDEYNEIAKNLDNYIEDEKWGKIIEDSKVFRGVIESVAPSPCSFLLLDKPISEEIGLIKVGDKMCCCIDGYQCDQWKFLKNDYLTVDVYKLISNVYSEIGQEIDDIPELLSKVGDNVWELYKNGITATLNQADSDFAKPLIMKYAPRNLAELSAWVAAIRPGFASLLNKFLNREDHTTGVEELDEVLKDSYHYMLYQESIMKFLVWLGIPEKNTYDILKKIAKKKFKEDELKDLKQQLHNNWIEKVGMEEGFNETWQVVEDASRYSFNASHALSVAIDSLYGAYLKANYPLIYMTEALNLYQDNIEKTAKITDELSYFNIKVLPPRFRYSKAEYMYDKKQNAIYKGVSSIKFLNSQVANELYELRDNKYDNFIDLIKDIKNTSVNSRQLEILIKLDYFKEFGKSKKLLSAMELVNKLYEKKQIKKDKLDDLLNLGVSIDLIKKHSNKEKDKMFKDININDLIHESYANLEDKDISIKDRLSTEIEYLGSPSTILPKASKDFYYVLELKIFKNKKSITYYPVLYDIKTGKQMQMKIKDFILFSENPFKEGNIIKVLNKSKEPKRKKEGDKWIQSKTEFNEIINYWEVY